MSDFSLLRPGSNNTNRSDPSDSSNDLMKINEITRLKRLIQNKLPDRIGNKVLFGITDQNEINFLKSEMEKIIEEDGTFLRKSETNEFLEPFILELTNLGKLTPFMDDPTVTEIMVNAYDEIWIEKKGELVLTNVTYKDNDELMDVATRIARNVGRLIDPTHPSVDARLPDGSRVHIIINPISRKGVTITIRKFFKERLTITDLIKYKTLDDEVAKFLEKAVKSKCNIIISGGTGSGKTTTLNILSNFISGKERVITIEDSAELQLSNAHVVSLETRNANAEGKGEVTIQELVRNSLRMRPDRIIIGEVRDSTAHDLMNAMSTGHEGSMATIHSNDPNNCISRLTSLVMEKGLGLPSEVIKYTIAESVDLIVQINRFSNGRKITHISQVYPGDNDNLIVEDLFVHDPSSHSNDRQFIRTDAELSNKIKSRFEVYDYNNSFNSDERSDGN